MSDLQDRDKNYVAGTYSRFPVEIVKGKGSLLYDGDGSQYIDMGTGIAVNTFGACDGIWAEAVKAQLDRVQHVSNTFYSYPCVELAELLCKATGMRKVFFGNSGAEANECAIKVARKYAAERHGGDCYNIITLKNSFHGRTITTLAATGQDVFHKNFQPLTPGFAYADANDLQSVKDLASKFKTAAVMIECVQGEGGVLPLEESFVKGLYNFCVEKDILLIVDEVQTGNGRTGKLYAYMNYGIQPDLVTTAKGLGGGLPIGACIFGGKVKDVLSYGDHGSTFGGNPIAAAGAVSIIKRLDESVFDGVIKRSNYIFENLSGADGIVSVNGMGLMIGIQTEKPAKQVVTECIGRGVLCLTAKDRVRLLPALNIPFNLLEKAIEIIKQVCAR